MVRLLLQIKLYRLLATLVITAFVLPIMAQESSEDCIVKRQASMKEVIDALESKLGIHFNYTTDQLASERFSFSVCGDKTYMIQEVGAVLGYQFTNLGAIDYSIKKLKKPLNAPVFKSTVIDIEGEPMIGANVYLPRLGYGAQSDSNGNVMLKGYFTDTEPVEITYLGYNKKVLSLKEFYSKSMVLQETDHQLQDVVITDSRFMRQSSPAIDRVDVNSLPIIGAGGMDILQQVQLTPGIYNSSESLDDLQIRGGTPDQVGMTWNGIPLFQNNLFYGRISVLNPSIIEEVDLIKNGALASSYTLASGSINGRTLYNDTSKISGSVYADLIHAGAAVSTNLFNNSFKLKAAARKSIGHELGSQPYNTFLNNALQNSKLTSDEFYKEFYQLDFIDQKYSSNFYDWNIAGRWSVTPRDIINFGVINYANKFSYSWNDTVDMVSKDDHLVQRSLGYSGSYERRWNKLSTTTLSLISSRFNRAYENIDYSLESDIEKSSFKEEYVELKHSLQIRKGIDLTVGYQFNKANSREEVTSEASPEVDRIKDVKGIKHIVFAGTNIRAYDWVKAYVGLRWNKYNRAMFDREIIEPRLHLHFYPTDLITLEAHYARTHQTFSRQQIFSPLQLDNGIWVVADELNSETFQFMVENSQYSLGAQFHDSNWMFKLLGYRKLMNNLWTSTFDFYWAENPYRYVNLDIKGIESSFQYQTEQFKSFLTYDYIVDEIINDQAGTRFRSPYSQPHRVSIGNVLTIGSLQFSILARYASGRFFSEAVDYIESQSPEGEIERELVYNELLDNQVTDYFNIDASILYAHSNIKIGLHGSNLLNRQNTIKNQYFIDFTRNPVNMNVQQWQGLPFMYNMTLEMNF